jgi:hypothetical protein
MLIINGNKMSTKSQQNVNKIRIVDKQVNKLNSLLTFCSIFKMHIFNMLLLIVNKTTKKWTT